MSELKPCPFCGKTPKHPWRAMPAFDECDNLAENIITRLPAETTSDGLWNARPIEDELRKRIAELEIELTNKEIEYTDLWDDALAFQSRVAELEAFIDQLIKAGRALVNVSEWRYATLPELLAWNTLIDKFYQEVQE